MGAISLCGWENRNRNPVSGPWAIALVSEKPGYGCDLGVDGKIGIETRFLVPGRSPANRTSYGN